MDKRYVQVTTHTNRDGEQLQVVRVEKSKPGKFDYLVFVSK